VKSRCCISDSCGWRGCQYTPAAENSQGYRNDDPSLLETCMVKKLKRQKAGSCLCRRSLPGDAPSPVSARLHDEPGQGGNPGYRHSVTPRPVG
jgi:hypothetical protein